MSSIERRRWSLRSMVFGILRRLVQLLAGVTRAGWILVAAVVTYALVFSEYLFAKFVDFRTGYYDFGNAIQLVWLASHGKLTTAVLGRPVLLIVAGVATVVPVPVALCVTEASLLALGAVPIYLIASLVLRSKWYALGIALLYLVYPPLSGVTQYEFHDLSLSIPFLLFMYYYYLRKSFVLFGIFAILALTSIEFIAVVLAFFFVSVIIEYLRSGRPAHLLRFLAGLGILVSAWIVYLQVSPDLANFSLSIVSNSAYTLTGSTAFLNPFAVFNNLQYSFQYDLGSKATYLVLLFAPLLLTPFLSLKWLLPSVPWLMVVLSYSPLLGQGGLGPPYGVWTQWSSFLIPFLFISAIYGFDKLSAYLSLKHQSNAHGRKRAAAFMAIAMAVAVVATGAFSPIVPQSEFSLGDNLVPNDTSIGETPHPVLPAPVPNATSLDWFVRQVPNQDSVLTQNVLGSKLSERTATVAIFGEPGWNPAVIQKSPTQAIIVDLQLPDMKPYIGLLDSILASNPYRLVLSDSLAGIYLYLLTP